MNDERQSSPFAVAVYDHRSFVQEKGRPRWPSFQTNAMTSVSADRSHVRGLKALRTLYDIELYGCALGEAAEALRLDCGKVDEHIFATFHRDEAKALRIVEPLDGTGATHS
jgi:hypothetical protein